MHKKFVSEKRKIKKKDWNRMRAHIKKERQRKEEKLSIKKISNVI